MSSHNFFVRLPHSRRVIFFEFQEDIRNSELPVLPIFQRCLDRPAGTLTAYEVLVELGLRHLDPSHCYVGLKDGFYQIRRDKNVLRVMLSEQIGNSPSLIQVVLSLALNWILIQEGFFGFHAAGVLRNGRVLMFPGQSGAGKTTICRHVDSDDVVICDENVSVIKAQNVSHSTRWRVSAAPPWGQSVFNPAFYLDGSWHDLKGWQFPLGAAIFLKNQELGPKTVLQKKHPISAAEELMLFHLQSNFTSPQPVACKKLAFRAIADLARTLPCFDMSVDLKSSFWKAIDERLGPFFSPQPEKKERPIDDPGLMSDKFLIERFERGALVMRVQDTAIFSVDNSDVDPLWFLLKSGGDVHSAYRNLAKQSNQHHRNKTIRHLETLWWELNRPKKELKNMATANLTPGCG